MGMSQEPRVALLHHRPDLGTAGVLGAKVEFSLGEAVLSLLSQSGLYPMQGGFLDKVVTTALGLRVFRSSSSSPTAFWPWCQCVTAPGQG